MNNNEKELYDFVEKIYMASQKFLADFQFSENESQNKTEQTIEPTGTSIYQCGLSIRITNALRHANIDYMEQLVELKESDLLGIRNLGATSIEEIKRCMCRLGLKPSEETTEMDCRVSEYTEWVSINEIVKELMGYDIDDLELIDADILKQIKNARSNIRTHIYQWRLDCPYIKSYKGYLFARTNELEDKIYKCKAIASKYPTIKQIYTVIKLIDNGCSGLPKTFSSKAYWRYISVNKQMLSEIEEWLGGEQK